SNSRRTPCATPAASFIRRATSSKKRLVVWVMGTSPFPERWRSNGVCTRPCSPRQLAPAPRGGGDRPRHQWIEAILGHQHVERRGGGAAGRGDVLPQRRGRKRRAVEQFAGACDRRARELVGQLGRQAGGHARLRHAFGKQ